MKFNEANFFVFIASIIIGLLISFNINFNKKPTRTFLTSKQYQNAYNERNRLYNEISSLKDQYNDAYLKFEKYKFSSSDSNEVIKEIEKELKTNEAILGKRDLEGEGISITITDASIEFTNNYFDVDLYRKALIHDKDILNIINDLKNAGAEVISLNGQRLINNTFAWCGGSYINVDGVKAVAPYYISAIGNKNALKNYLSMDDSYLKKMMVNRKIKVQIEEMDNVVIPAYIGDINYKYMKVAK